jgi:isocitrate lyase
VCRGQAASGAPLPRRASPASSASTRRARSSSSAAPSARLHGRARDAAAAFFERLRELFAEGKCITTFGPYSPGQAVTMKRMGIEGIYLGGWATSAKGSMQEDPGPDLASYPLSQVPNEAAPIVRALLTADKNQFHARARMTDEQRAATPEVDFRPFIIADADTGHGGDAHVRNLVRRFVEVGVPGYHIEDQKPGVKKCGHQGGKVLVSEDEQIKRSAPRASSSTSWACPGSSSRAPTPSRPRCSTAAATSAISRSSSARRTSTPTFKAAFLAHPARFHRRGIEELSGHQLYACATRSTPRTRGSTSTGLGALIDEAVLAYQKGGPGVDTALDKVFDKLVDVWQAEADVKTYGEAVADVMRFRASEGVQFAMTEDEWLAFARAPRSTRSARRPALGINVIWDCEHAKTPDGYYQVRGGIDYAIAKSLAVAPYADILWMETKTADLHDAKKFADAIHAFIPTRCSPTTCRPRSTGTRRA